MELPDIINVIESAFRKFSVVFPSYTVERTNSSESDPVTAVIFQLIYRSKSSFDGKCVVVWLVTKLVIFSLEPKDH